VCLSGKRDESSQEAVAALRSPSSVWKQREGGLEVEAQRLASGKVGEGADSDHVLHLGAVYATQRVMRNSLLA
jgi:hypothetical protein